MKKFTLFLICFIAGSMLLGCQRGVHAGNEDEYQPRPAPVHKPDNHEIKGELVRVDLKDKTVAIRVENGMVQTFDFDENVTVVGLDNPSKGKSPMQDLLGKEGSEVTVKWSDHKGAKMASNVEVTQIVTAKTPSHTRHRH
jgi:hypothetical protein